MKRYGCLGIMGIGYVVGALITWAVAIRAYECSPYLDRQTCRSFAISDGYMLSIFWPAYWIFETRDGRP